MPSAPIVSPYGSWKSPLRGATVYEKNSTISDLLVDTSNGKLFHVEFRPSEGGRFVLLNTMVPLKTSERSTIKTHPKPVVPRSSNVRSRVHEYGGGAARVHGDFAYWSEFENGRIYRRQLSRGDDEGIEAVTPESDVHRYADFDFHPVVQHLLICVKEDHTKDTPSKVKTSIVLVNTMTKGIVELCPALEEGFYAFPRFGGKEGSKVAWIEWRHPDMPWDGTELYYSDFSVPETDKPISLAPKKVAGEHGKESINDVRWGLSNPDEIYYLSDVTGHVNLWSVDLSESNLEPKLAMDSLPYDLGEPLWRLAPSWYAVLSEKDGLVAPNINGIRKISHLELATGKISEIANDYVDITDIHRLSDRQAVFLAGKFDEQRRIVIVSLGSVAGSATFQELEMATTQGGPKLCQGFISRGECLTLKIDTDFSDDANATDDKTDLHVVFYPPTNPDYRPREGELPPTIVQIHGGPTARAPPVFSIFHQYFTTRGFAVLDIDYRGSSGYGREYARRLYGKWGVVDVHDTIQAVVQMSKLGKIDGARVALRASSAGGFTALACLADCNVFTAAVMLYGISDVKLLAGGDSSKFESCYASNLMGGTLEEIPEVYEERSPINKADRIGAKLLMFQGLKDQIVKPERTRDFAKQIKMAGGSVETVFYADEGHKIRKLENLTDSLVKTEVFLKKAFDLE